MNLSIHNELAKLQDELTTLEQAVKHIGKAEQISTAVIQATEAVQENYAIHLTNIMDLLEKSVVDTQQELKNLLENFDIEVVKTTEATQKEFAFYRKESQKVIDKSISHIQLALKNTLEKFDTDSDRILTAYQTQIHDISNILDSYSHLVSHTQHFLDNLKQLNFSTRLDRLDLAISNVNQNVQNTLKKVETLEHKIKNENLNRLIQLANQDKKIKVIQALLFLLLALSIGTITMLF